MTGLAPESWPDLFEKPGLELFRLFMASKPSAHILSISFSIFLVILFKTTAITIAIYKTIQKR